MTVFKNSPRRGVALLFTGFYGSIILFIYRKLKIDARKDNIASLHKHNRLLFFVAFLMV